MTHRPEPDERRTAADPPGAVEALRPDALQLAAALRVTAAVLAVPAVTVAVGALLGFVIVGATAGSALASGGSVLRWVVLSLALIGVAIAVAFLLRVRVTWRAAQDEAELADDILGLVDVQAVTTAVLADLVELTSQEGGLRAVSRARAFWRVLRRLDITEHVASFDRARWFLPPELAATWLLAQAVSWGGLVAWILVPAVGIARLAGGL